MASTRYDASTSRGMPSNIPSDAVAMEKRMYQNSYLKRADKAPSYDDPDLTEAEKVPGCLCILATLLVEDFFFAVHLQGEMLAC